MILFELKYNVIMKDEINPTNFFYFFLLVKTKFEYKSYKKLISF